MSIPRLAPPALVRFTLLLFAVSLIPVAAAAQVQVERRNALDQPAGQVVDPSAESAAAATTQAAEQVSMGELVFILAWLGVALVLALGAGVLRPRSILGPERVPPDKPVWPLVLVLVIAAVAFVGSQVAYIAYLQASQMRASGGERRPITLEEIGAGDFAVLATVPFILGFAVLILGNKTLGRLSSPHFGMDARHAASGVGKGVVGFVIAMPVVLAVTVGMQWFYQAIGYQHPTEHELLTVLREVGRTSPVFWALIFGATVLAPLAEEALFRGQMQTILTAMFTPKRRPALPPPPLPVFVDAAVPQTVPVGEAPAPYLSPEQLASLPPLPPPPPESLGYVGPTAEAPAPPRAPWQPWLSIGITALIFAVFHPAWTIPAIFVLAACLGYAYERTGNLYVPITMHLLFNSMQTAMFVMMQKPA